MKRTEGEHRLFLGPFQPDLESEFLALIKKKKEGDPLAPMPVLVGSNLLGVYLRRFLVLSGLDHMNLRFLLSSRQSPGCRIHEPGACRCPVWRFRFVRSSWRRSSWPGTSARSPPAEAFKGR
jgi:hypothetical protein